MLAGMAGDAFIPYAPLNTLKPVAEDVWIVDGPEIRYGAMGLKIPFPTRMTIVRLHDGGLFVHSPIAPDDALFAAVEALGPVAHLIAPSTIHYWWVPDWQARYPRARVHGVPGLVRSAKRPLAVDAELGDAPPLAWAGEIDQVLFTGDVVTEADFFHRASSTLVLTDLIENFEPVRVKSRWLRWLVRAAHVADPHGSAPYDMRLTFLRHKKTMRAGVRRMLAWNPQRVILAHGRWYERDGAAELARAFAWAL
jgi:hypothetical protein